MRVLVLGGYGNFGARISRALAADPAIDLLVGGRSAAQAEAFVRTLATTTAGGACSRVIDHQSAGLAGQLKQHDVDLVIHSAGPFQAQGYRVAQAAADAGAHYIDLADGRRFVCDFPGQLNETFLKAGRCAISGASTVPALSSAVVSHLSAGWQRIDTIDMCIAPAQSAPRGKATMAAVLSYCGEPIKVWQQGQWYTQPGWARPARETFARLKPRLGALCDIPDLEIFPQRFAVSNRVMFRAALEVGFAQRCFAMLASLHAHGVLPHPEKLAGFLDTCSPALDFLGTSLGGMSVKLGGLDANGQPVKRSWHIAADNDHGPEIPCMAAILLARKLASATSDASAPTLPTGAHACVNLLALEAFHPEFARWGMVTDVIEGEIA